MTRYERIAAGLQVCASDNGCHRRPMLDGQSRVRPHGLCRPCYELVLEAGQRRRGPHVLADPVSIVIDVERRQRWDIQTAARLAGLSMAEWIRRACAAGLAQPTSRSESGSGGPST